MKEMKRTHKNCLVREPVLSMQATARLNALDLGGLATETRSQMDKVNIMPCGQETLFVVSGAGCVRSVVLTCEKGGPIESLRVAVCADQSDMAQVEGFVTDFFLSGWEGRETMGVFSGKKISTDGRTALYRMIDIPYGDGCIITLKNDSEEEAAAVELVTMYQSLETPITLGNRGCRWM